MVNKAILGYLTSDTRKRVTRSGTELAHLIVETRESWRTEDGARHDHVEHHEVTIWSWTHQPIDAQIHPLTRGTPVYVQGRIQTAYRRDEVGNEIEVKRIMSTKVRIMPVGRQADDDGE